MNSLIYFLIWGGLFFLMMRFGCGAHVMGHGHAHSDGRDAPNSGALPPPPDKAVDPVCHMAVDTPKAKSAVYSGQVYYFCSQDCRAKFEGDPPTYAKAASEIPASREHQHAV